MLDDLLTSAKGPGVIGALLGMIVLAGFCGLGLAVWNGDLEGENRMSLAQVVESQADKIAALQNDQLKIKERIAQRKQRASLRSKAEGFQTREKLAAEEGDRIAQEVSAAKAGLAELRAAKLKYRDDYRAAERSRAAGEALGELKAADGTVFKNVKIKSVDAIGIKIEHVNGIKRVAFEDLPPAMQDRFQFSADERSVAVAKVNATMAEFDKGAEIAHEREKKQRAVMAKQEQAEQLKRWQSTIAKLESGISSARNRISDYRRKAADYRRMHSDALARGNRSMHISKANEYDRKAANTERDIATAQRQILDLKQKIASSR